MDKEDSDLGFDGELSLLNDEIAMSDLKRSMNQEYHQKYANDPKYVWVNCCSMYIEKSKLDDGECPNHQKVKHDSDGVPYLKYDEFDQDGE